MPPERALDELQQCDDVERADGSAGGFAVQKKIKELQANGVALGV